jgi:rhodanese-related sulfurtransferase
MLADIVKSKEIKKDYMVVDVRGDDFQSGHIKGAHNSPASTFSDDVHELVNQTKDTPIVVFHYISSNNRGPRTAQVFLIAYCEIDGPMLMMMVQIYAQTRDALQTEGKDQDHEVYILQGGFKDFQAKFKVRCQGRP